MLTVTLVVNVVPHEAPLPSLGWSFKTTTNLQGIVKGHPCFSITLSIMFCLSLHRGLTYSSIPSAADPPLLLMGGCPCMAVEGKQAPWMSFKIKLCWRNLFQTLSRLFGQVLFHFQWVSVARSGLLLESFHIWDHFSRSLERLGSTNLIAWMCPHLCGHFLCDRDCQYTSVSGYGM